MLFKLIQKNLFHTFFIKFLQHPIILIKLQRCLQNTTIGRSNNDNLSQFLQYFSKDSLIDQVKVQHLILYL
jgi:hypothetical protein